MSVVCEKKFLKNVATENLEVHALQKPTWLNDRKYNQ